MRWRPWGLGWRDESQEAWRLHRGSFSRADRRWGLSSWATSERNSRRVATRMWPLVQRLQWFLFQAAVSRPAWALFCVNHTSLYGREEVGQGCVQVLEVWRGALTPAGVAQPFLRAQ